MKKAFLAFAVLSFLTVLIAACGGSASSVNTPNTVHMSDSSFVQSSITIKKGSTLTLVDDVGSVHIIANGSWVNGASQPAIEPGAPTVQVAFNGGDTQAVGTFTSAGTFHLFCTVHQNMNLTVTVQ